MKRDTKQTLLAVMPLFAIVIFQILNSFGMLSHFIDVLAAFGYININSPVPLVFCILVAGPLFGPTIWAAGWTWAQLKAVYGFVGIPLSVAASILMINPATAVFGALLLVAAGGFLSVAA